MRTNVARYRALSAVISLFFLSLITVGCEEEEAAQKLTVVKTVKTEVTRPVQELSATALLEPEQEAILSFQVSGQVSGELKEAGDSVQKGDVLAQIMPESYEWQAEAADAQWREAQAAWRQVQAGARAEEMKQAEAAVKQAEANATLAQNNYARMKALFEAGAIAQADLEKVEASLQTASQQLIQAQQALQMAVNGARDEEKQQVAAKVSQAEAQKALSMEQLSKTKLTAPFSGVVLEKYISTGELVGPGRQIYRFGNITSLKVVLPVSSREIQDWHAGDQVMVWKGTDSKPGKIVRVAPATQRYSGTVAVEVVIDNKDGKWLPGEAVIVKKEIAAEKGIYLPAGAVVQSGEGDPFVFVIEQDNSGNWIAHKQTVQVTQLIGEQLLVASGLKEGQQVVVEGAHRLSDGTRVQAEEAEVN